MYVRTTPVKCSPYPPTKSGIVSYLLRYMYIYVICVYVSCSTPCCRLIRIAGYIWEFYLIKSIRISLQNWKQVPCTAMCIKMQNSIMLIGYIVRRSTTLSRSYQFYARLLIRQLWSSYRSSNKVGFHWKLVRNGTCVLCKLAPSCARALHLCFHACSLDWLPSFLPAN